MESVGIAQDIAVHFPDAIIDQRMHRNQLALSIKRDSLVAICDFLKTKHQMNHLNCLCGVDNLKRKGKYHSRFEVIYQLYSIDNRVALRLNAQVPEDDPSIDSVTSLWTGANWLERETYDLVGIHFNNHPNLERILTPTDWQGHPLRKDYPLRGPEEWQGLVDLKELSEKLRCHGYDTATQDEADTDLAEEKTEG